jgi:hypothetical protein
MHICISDFLSFNYHTQTNEWLSYSCFHVFVAIPDTIHSYRAVIQIKKYILLFLLDLQKID